MTTWLLGVVRYAVAVALVVAAAWKVRDFRAFGATLAGYGIRAPWDRPAAVAVIAAEAATAITAFLPVSDRFAGAPVAALGAVFLASQVYVLSTGAHTPCLCFGAANAEPPSAKTAARAALVHVAGLLLLLAGAGTGRALNPLAVLAAPVLLAASGYLLRAIPRRFQ
jgi:hypothetical protein